MSLKYLTLVFQPPLLRDVECNRKCVSSWDFERDILTIKTLNLPGCLNKIRKTFRLNNRKIVTMVNEMIISSGSYFLGRLFIGEAK
jgi:hypothetical protein